MKLNRELLVEQAPKMWSPAQQSRSPFRVNFKVVTPFSKLLYSCATLMWECGIWAGRDMHATRLDVVTLALKCFVSGAQWALAAAAHFSALLPPLCDISTSLSLAFASAKPGADKVFPSTPVGLSVEAAVCSLFSLSFVSSPFVLTAFLFPIVDAGPIGDDGGEESRGRDASVEGLREDGDRDRFRSSDIF